MSGKKLTHEEFLKRIGSERLKEYTVLEKYNGSENKIFIRHNLCNKTYRTTASLFMQGYGCPHCRKFRRHTTSEFKEHVKRLTGDEYLVIGGYVNNLTKVKIKHVKCGNYFNMTPAHFKTGERCPYCFGKHKKNTEQFKTEVFNLVGDEYEVLGEYINANAYILMKHNTCGYTWRITPNKFLNTGRRCPRCAGNIKKTTIQFKKEVLDLVGKEYSVLGEYKGNKMKILLRHNSKKCNFNEFETKPSNFLSGKRCPKCCIKRGEEHPHYNPYLTEEDRKKRKHQNGLLKIWRNRVFKRDDYTCLICGCKGGDLNAHHLNSWNKYKEERFKVNNGVTLCKECHAAFHKIYGRGNNTKEQLTEFQQQYIEELKESVI